MLVEVHGSIVRGAGSLVHFLSGQVRSVAGNAPNAPGADSSRDTVYNFRRSAGWPHKWG